MDKSIYNKCKYIIAKRELIEKEYEYCERVLNEMLKMDDKESKVYELLGKLYLHKNYLSKAKESFLKVKELDENNYNIYYGLLRIDILKEDYISAKENLNKYLEMQNNKNLNLDLYKLLIDKCLQEDNTYNIDDRFFYEKLNGNNLILYLNGVKNILEEDYIKAKKLFSELEQNVIREKIFITFKYVVELIENLMIKKFYISQKDYEEKIDLLMDYRWNEEHQNIKELIDEVLSYDLSDEQIINLLHQIPRILDIDEYEASIKICKIIKNNDKFNKFSRMTSFYERLIRELKEIYDLKDEKREQFQLHLRKGITALNDKEYAKALDIFEAGLYKTNINLFNYYCGKANFMLEKYKQARNYFNIYSNGGAYRISYCKNYLAIIDKRFGKKGKAIKLAEDAEYFAGLLNQEYENKLSVDNEDKKLKKFFKLIDMTEEDFLDEKNKVLKK